MKTQFKMGFLSPEYETSSKVYDMPEEGMPRHKILEKGKGRINGHNYSYGHTKVIYKSTSLDSYKQIDKSDSHKEIDCLMTNAHGSELAEQQRRLIALQQANTKPVSQTLNAYNKFNTFKPKKCATPSQQQKFADNLRKTHFTFGNSNEFKNNRNSVSAIKSKFDKVTSVTGGATVSPGSEITVYGKGQKKVPSSITFGSQKSGPLRSSYQLNHNEIKPVAGTNEGPQYVEK